MKATYKSTDQRWICWPNLAITENCLRGTCSSCTKPPYRKKISYGEVKALAAMTSVTIKEVNQGMLWRPVVRRTVRAKTE